MKEMFFQQTLLKKAYYVKMTAPVMVSPANSDFW